MSQKNQKKQRKLAARAASQSMRANQPSRTSRASQSRPAQASPSHLTHLTDLNIFAFTGEDFERAAHWLRLQPTKGTQGTQGTKAPQPTGATREFRPLFSCPRSGDPLPLAQRAVQVFRDRLLGERSPTYAPRHMLGVWPLQVAHPGLPTIRPKG